MSEVVSTTKALQDSLSDAEPSAFLVEARVIRRIIRERHGVTNLALALPHTQCQVVPCLDVLKLAHPDELGLKSFQSLPEECLLICQPEGGELDHWPLPELKQQVWRRLFHAILDRELQRVNLQSYPQELRRRIAEFGQVEFDEAHYVLRSELRLMSPKSRDEAWRELAAVYFELRYFEPDLLPIWFPALSEPQGVEDLLSHDLDIPKIFERSRLEGAPSPALISHTDSDEDRLLTTRRNWSMASSATKSERGYLRQLRKRDRAIERGNTVFSIACAIRAVHHANSERKKSSAKSKAREDVARLVSRLRNAIDFQDRDTQAWQTALWELAENSIHGFWNAEKRLLYDLQKVCLDHERLTYKVDLVKWLVSRGKRPVRRPLMNLREVAMAKHLASAASRLTYVRLSGNDRNRLTELIQNAASLSESQMRDRMRPVLYQTLLSVDLIPKSIPEQVAMDKLVDEALDCIADRGYLTMGYLRDAISRNDLKLPDIQEAREVWHGDSLLRADDRLDLSLDGVYRRGEFYLRWLQVVSSFFFGTRFGRFATLYLIIPFGGAVVIVEGALHVLHLFGSHHHESGSESTADHDADASPSAILPVAEPQKPNPVADSSNQSIQENRNKTGTTVPSSDVLLDSSQEASLDQTESIVSVAPKTTDEAVGEILSQRTETFSLVLILGLLLLALIHVPSFRKQMLTGLTRAWRFLRAVVVETPLFLLKLPVLTRLWTSKPFVRLRRYMVVPCILAIIVGRTFPWLAGWNPLEWWGVATIALLTSTILNTRMGRDTQEVTRDWIENALHQLQARFVFAFIGWIVDFFRLLLGTLERVLYAVDEWLRFHSDENWLSILAKAILGVAWSFVSFLIRIYVNLLIEPTFHPVKHFPVVTVAHKILLPALIMLEGNMVHFLGQYVGTPIARSITWFNIFFLPGFFGFAVWELKENWKLYLSNRINRIGPVPVGSHGETLARLLRPGFHSGTLPKIFRKLRKLEHRDSSLGRFTSRRSAQEQLHHVEQAIRFFVDRELIALLQKSPSLENLKIACTTIQTASNSFSVELVCSSHPNEPAQFRFQEQSGWLIATIAQTGWLELIPSEQRNSVLHALEGFYRKGGIDLVREQLENNLTREHPYDIDSEGLRIWPSQQFEVELVANLRDEKMIAPLPSLQASQAGLKPIEREKIVFSATETEWTQWERTWLSKESSSDESSKIQLETKR